MKKIGLLILAVFIFASASQGFGSDTCGLAEDIMKMAESTFEKDKKEGLKLFIKAKTLCNNPVYDYNLGMAYWSYGLMDKAEIHIKGAVKKQEKSLWLNNLAGILSETGKNEEALLYAKKAVSMSSHAPFIHTLAKIYFNMGDDLKALETISDASDNLDPRIKEFKAIVRQTFISKNIELFNSGNRKTSLDLLSSVKNDPEICSAYIMLLAKSGDIKTAINEAEKAEKRFSSTKEVLGLKEQIINFAVLGFYNDFKSGNPAIAVASAKKFHEENPDSLAAKKAFEDLFDAYIKDAVQIEIPKAVENKQAYASGSAASSGYDISSILDSSKTNVSLESEIEKNLKHGKTKKPYGVAVIIGNKNYSRYGNGICDVKYADRDALFMKKYLVKTLGYDEKNIIFKTDATSGDLRNIFGTTENPRGRLHNYLRKGESEVFVYYSGHGAPGSKGETAFLVPVDASADYIENNGYSMETFYSSIENLDAKNLTIVFDACFSGDSAGGSLFKKISPALLKNINPAKNIKNASVFCSADKDQVASWYTDKRHGLFTYFFLMGMSGFADNDKNNEITVGEMKTYLLKEVPYWARRETNRIQSPVVKGQSLEVLAVLK